jgi:CheY-like chemotaxis protein/two-component sensor histidine kinase
LSQHSDTGGAVRDDAARILAASDRAAALIAKLSSLTGKKSGKPELLDLGEAFATLEPRLRESLPEGILLSFVWSREKLPVLMDSAQLEEIIFSLIDNARDAMPKGGKIAVAVQAQASWIVLKVSDNGCGMSAEAAAHAFDPFFSTKTRRKSTGLSLALAHAMMRDAGGDIAIVSKEHSGTTVTLSFPRVAAQGDLLPAAAASRAKAAAGGETILVVEDDEDVLDAMSAVLARSGYKVLCAADGVQGLEMAKLHNGTIDAVLSDVSMPGMNGYELARALRAFNPASRILLMSGNNDGRGEMVLGKPFRPQELILRMRQLLDMPPPAPQA